MLKLNHVLSEIYYSPIVIKPTFTIYKLILKSSFTNYLTCFMIRKLTCLSLIIVNFYVLKTASVQLIKLTGAMKLNSQEYL
jgi:hypothetical protein